MASKSEKIAIANRLKEVREKCQYTQEAFAADLEISCSGYKKIESGENGLSLDIILMLYKLGFPVDYIIFGDMKDTQALWNQLERCSEEDKFSIMLQLMLYFTQTKKKAFQVGNIEFVQTNIKDILDLLKTGK